MRSLTLAALLLSAVTGTLVVKKGLDMDGLLVLALVERREPFALGVRGRRVSVTSFEMQQSLPLRKAEEK